MPPLVPVFMVVPVGLVRIHLHRLIVSETHSKVIRQQGIRYPSSTLHIEIDSPSCIVVDLICGVIAIAVLGSIAMGGGMRWWTVPMGWSGFWMIARFAPPNPDSTSGRGAAENKK